MSITAKSLVFIQLADSKGDIYVPATGVKGLIHTILLGNDNTTAEEVRLLFHDGTNEYPIFPKVTVGIGDTAQLEFIGEGLVVNDGSKITGYTTTAAKVTFQAFGSEEVV